MKTQLMQRWQQVSQYLADWSDSLLAAENTLQQKDKVYNWQAWLLPTLLGLLFALQNPLLYGMAPAYDASLFATMGKMWADGAVLYRDMIDINTQSNFHNYSNSFLTMISKSHATSFTSFSAPLSVAPSACPTATP